MTGHPDFQDYPVWRSDNLFASNVTVFPAGNTQGQVLPAAHAAAVLLRVAPSAGSGQVAVHWFLDAAATQGVGTQIWRVNMATQLGIIMPARGNYVRIDINATSAGGMTAATYLATANTAPPQAMHITSALTLGPQGQAVAAGATNLYPANALTRGRGMLVIEPADAAAALSYQVQITDEAGAVTGVLYDAGKPAAAVSGPEFLVPDSPVQLAITNTDGAAPHTTSAVLTMIQAA